MHLDLFSGQFCPFLARFDPFWLRLGIRVRDRVIGVGLGWVGLGWIYLRTLIDYLAVVVHFVYLVYFVWVGSGFGLGVGLGWVSARALIVFLCSFAPLWLRVGAKGTVRGWVGFAPVPCSLSCGPF